MNTINPPTVQQPRMRDTANGTSPGAAGGARISSAALRPEDRGNGYGGGAAGRTAQPAREDRALGTPPRHEHGGGPSGRDEPAVDERDHGPEGSGGVSGEARRRKPKSKARITAASLNIRGYGQENQVEGSSKWMRVNQLVRDRKIAILALQETHLDEERAKTLNSIFGRNLEVLYSPDPEHGTGARGVAMVINKRILKDCKPEIRTIVPGRAILLTAAWSADRTLKILNVYAPNNSAENAEFWRTLARARLGRVDLMMGDCNLVEDGADRLPPRDDPAAPREALLELCGGLGIKDGWRLTHPMDRGFTYMQTSTLAQSRLDRIYGRMQMMRDCSDWTIMESGIVTDHQLVAVTIENYKAPFIGKGRWVMPAHLLADEEMKKSMKDLGRKLVTRLERLGPRTPSENAQMVYADFKDALVCAARQRAKAKVPKMQKRIDSLKEDHTRVLASLNEPAQSEDDMTQRREQLAALQDRITSLERKRFEWKRKEVATRHWAQSETMSKYWMRGNTTPEVTEVMYSMLQPGTNPPTYTNHSKTMAEIARTFYDRLQDDDPLEEGEDHEAYVAEALLDTDAKVCVEDKEEMAKRLDNDDIADAIKDTATGKAPGLDGLPAEVWKTYARWYAADSKRGQAGVDVAGALRTVFNDIEAHGLVEGSEFAHGWICPVYKLKKDKREINNYRPITLLNSDYKLMTRALAAKLARVAPSVVHEDQAGFIPGRRIFDHIRLSQLMIEYAEAEEINGAIVALDQEKAYDKVDHAYLWSALRHMNFPENFVRTLQHLYAGARSCVIVNGVRSGLFKIWRGVRQGDPISCLVFDLAIEPLACALRKSTLWGLKLPGEAERLIAKLFADDTTVYLSSDDEYTLMQSIAERWCRASRARFNHEKTEVLPIGSKEYRDEVVRSRKLSPNSQMIPDNAHIVSDGNAIRSLGAWIGNTIDHAAPWTPIIDVIETNLAKWSKGKPVVEIVFESS